jgi:hypothetical protein
VKKAILHRKNSLFYKARVGELFMSLIHTCELCGANPFDSLTQVQRHAAKFRAGSLALDALELSRDVSTVWCPRGFRLA